MIERRKVHRRRVMPGAWAASHPLPSQTGGIDLSEAGEDDPAQQTRDRALLARRIAAFVTHRRRPEQAPC